jgi:serine/threonine protein kinase
MFDKIDEEEKKAKAEAKGPQLDLNNNEKTIVDKTASRWSKKLVKITKFNEKLQAETEPEEKSVGPNNFVALMKLGQGSFGIVYLVEKMKYDEETKVATKTGKYYAMKILNKK